MKRIIALAALSLWLVGCASQSSKPAPGTKAFVGAAVFDGTGAPAIENATILVKDGKVEAVGPAASVTVPAGVETVDLKGKYVTPGWIVGHGHLGASSGLKTGPEIYTEQTLKDQLGLYARYGSTTLVSLGGDGPEALKLRNEQNTAGLNRARVFVAGKVIDAETPEAARQMVDENVANRVDWIKIRVDDNLGSTKKMTPAVYQAVIDEAHQKGFRVAVHLYYLADAKAVLKEGADYIVHSVRDKPVDDELISMLKDKKVCLSPTLTREVSTFVYEQEPDFFSDPFFLKDADPDVLTKLKDPERQKAMAASKSAQTYKKQMPVAMENLKKLAEAGVPIVFGTDTGPPARFQGYFEHMEMALMVKAGLSPEQALRSATGVASECLGLNDVGTLQPGRWADLVVFDQSPWADIANTKTLQSVWIAGNRVPEAKRAAATD